MRSSTVAALLALTVASPALSARFSDGTYARELLSRQADTQGQFRGLPTHFRTLGLPVHRPMVTVPIRQPQVPPQVTTTQPSQAPQRREFEELVARELLETLIGREVTDESGAFKLPSFVKHIPGFIEGLLGGGGSPPPPPAPAPTPTNDPTSQPQRRNVDELVARELISILAARDLGVDESGALNIGKLISFGGKVAEALLGGGDSAPAPQQSQPPQRREFEDIVTRELLNAIVARDDVDESGAINFGKLFSFGSKVAHALLSGGDSAPAPQPSQPPQRRELEEFVLRAITSQVGPALQAQHGLKTEHKQSIKQKGQKKHHGHHHNHHHHHGNGSGSRQQSQTSVRATASGSSVAPTDTLLPVTATPIVGLSSGAASTSTSALTAASGEITARSLYDLD